MIDIFKSCHRFEKKLLTACITLWNTFISNNGFVSDLITIVPAIDLKTRGLSEAQEDIRKQNIYM